MHERAALGYGSPDSFEEEFAALRRAVLAVGILSIALQLVDGAAEGPPGGPCPVFPAGDPLGLAGHDARGFDRLLPRPGIGGQFLCRVAGDMAQEERHGGILANRAVCRQTGG